MNVLHGIYENGEIKITDENPPNIKARVIIHFEEISEAKEAELNEVADTNED